MIAGLARHDSSLAEWGKESCIILRLCFHLPQCLVFTSLLFRWVKQETEISRESQEADTRPKLDLGFKEGQTIKLNIGVRSEVDSASFSGYVSGDCSSLVLPLYTEHDDKERRSSQASCVWIRGPKPASTSTRRQNCSLSHPSSFFHSHCQPSHTATRAEIQ